MTPQEIASERQKIIEKYGEWTDHNIRLAEGVYTISPDRHSIKLRRVLQIVADLAGKPLNQLRVLDLACLEGQYAIEFALQGAESVAIEGRDANIEKARFAKRVLGLDKLTLFQDDVRNLSKEKYGEFDVVLCLGILYHLDAPDVFQFVQNIASVCKHLAVFDTYFGMEANQPFDFKGRQLWGRLMIEHDPSADTSEQLQDKWASIGNRKSVWMTRSALLNLMIEGGFTTAFECHVPLEPGKFVDRVTIAGIKGVKQPSASIPTQNNDAMELIAEPFEPAISPRQEKHAELSRQLTHLVPRGVRRFLKSLLGRS